MRPFVLQRDGYRCQIDPECPLRADVVDHIRPVYPGMPDSEFFDTANLRASCEPHNLFRAAVARAQGRRPKGVPSAVVVRNYSRPRPKSQVVIRHYGRG